MIKRSIILLALFAFFAVSSVPANETDQYNLPPKPLADIAPEVEAYVAQKIQTAIDKLNAEIAKHEVCVSSPHVSKRQPVDRQPEPRPKTCLTEKREQDKLAQLRFPDAVAKAVHDQLGAGNIFISNTGKWLNTNKFEHEPSRYTQPFTESIYWERPINYATLSPTIRMYGVEFGTDKIDHIFQQGYTYYRKYNAARKEGKSDAYATRVAVAWGRSTENLFFGYAVSGVYSNADLAANLAGLRFYQNLSNDVQLGDATRPAILRWGDDHWQFVGPHAAPRAAADASSGGTVPRAFLPLAAVAGEAARVPADRILRPFITDHLNEAYNPSNYLPLLYKIVRAAVKKHACSEWHAAFPTLTAAELNARTSALTTWNGVDYGYKQTRRQVRLAEVCFADVPPRRAG